MARRWLGIGVTAIVVMILIGCGTNMHGDHQSVLIMSTPTGANITIEEHLRVTTPGTVSLSRKGNYTAVVEKEGFEPTTIQIDRSWSWWVIGDVLGCLIVFAPFCIHKDVHDGGFYTFDDEIAVALTPTAAAELTAPKSP